MSKDKKSSVVLSDIERWLRSVNALSKDLDELAAAKKKYQAKMNQIASKYKEKEKKKEDKKEDKVEKSTEDKNLDQKIQPGRAKIGQQKKLD